MSPALSPAAPRRPAGTAPMRQRVYVAAQQDVYHAAVLAYALVQQAGARTLLATEAATLVSELGMNIVKYAGRGSLTLSVDGDERRYLEVLAVDNGPGIEDLALALTDRYSSHGTLGLGLPGVRRMSDDFECRSQPGAGTTVRARRYFETAPAQPQAQPAEPAQGRAVAPACAHGTAPAWQHALAKRPCFGEVVSGDGTLAQAVPGGFLFGILDVLGHGPQAHALARHCERWLAAHAHADLIGTVEALHRETRGSLGLALTLALADAEAGSLVAVGVGNTRLFRLGGPGICVDAQPGIVGGLNMPRLRPVRLQIRPHDVLMLVTDGISERLDAQTLLPLRTLDVQPIAQHMLREHGKNHDDATCLVLRCPA